MSAVAPPAVALALRADIVARIADSQATQAEWEMRGAALRAQCVAATTDAVHVEACPPHLQHWRELVDAEERRAQTGAPLTVARVLALEEGVFALKEGVSAREPMRDLERAPGPISAALTRDSTPLIDLAALDDALRPGGQPRPILLRAVAVSAAIGSGPLAELVPALLLCSAGLTEQLRLLPFIGADPVARASALQAWRAGELDSLAALLLGECAEAARARRVALRAALRLLAEDESLVEPYGRAAIMMRRALAVLRASLATSMPALAVRLECSRPAAGDALERLVECGLAVEITGRQRDRVYACARAYAIA